MTIRAKQVLVFVASTILLAASTQNSAGSDDGQARKPVVVEPIIVDTPIAAFQMDLLDVAFNAYRDMPLNPHVKNRSRGQEDVVRVCLELRQPQRALACVKQIADWRRGAAYADLALYCARQGDEAAALEHIEVARRVADSAEDWRRDTIRVKIAMTYAWLGKSDLAVSIEAGLAESESGKVDSVRAMLATTENAQAQMDALDRAIDTGKFDLVKNALEAYAQLFNRLYDDAERRGLIEKKIKARWDIVPIVVRFDLLLTLADFALEHKDQAKALTLVNEAKTILESVQWLPEDQVPMMARLATRRFRAGEQDRARMELGESINLFAAQRHLIVNIYRARALRPIAEAYAAMGDQATAMAVYKKAVEAGVENPNSRPRADDLSATCCSMALIAFEPDEELWARIRQIRNGLGDPW